MSLYSGTFNFHNKEQLDSNNRTLVFESQWKVTANIYVCSQDFNAVMKCEMECNYAPINNEQTKSLRTNTSISTI